MVISTPPATVPPAALLPAAHVAAANPAPHGWTTYRVRSGDTLYGIAARFRTTAGVLATRNSIRNPRALMVGAVLTVPRTSAPAKAPARAGARSQVYVVRAGDTLFDIAVRFRVPLASLLKANHLSTRSFIQPGQRIVVRATGGKAAAPRSRATATTTYRVRAGDTLGTIATRHHTTVAAIARASRISSRSLIYPGQVLRLPGTATSARRAVPDTFNGRTYPRAVAEAAARNRAILARRTVPSRSETKTLIVRIARQQGVDTRLALAIAYQESGWNQRAVSPANAVGVMQVIPEAGQWASGLVGRRLDLLRASDNITAGVVMLRSLGRSTNNMEKTVAAYYQGLGALQTHGMFSDTKLYVRNVMALRATM